MSKVSRSEYQKVVEENKRLIADIKLLVEDGVPSAASMLCKGKYRDRFQKEKEYENVLSLHDLNVGDKVTIRFAQRYDQKIGYSEFYDADYVVKHNQGKWAIFEHCEHRRPCHKMFNVGARNSREWIVGKYMP